MSNYFDKRIRLKRARKNVDKNALRAGKGGGVISIDYRGNIQQSTVFIPFCQKMENDDDDDTECSETVVQAKKYFQRYSEPAYPLTLGQGMLVRPQYLRFLWHIRCWIICYKLFKVTRQHS